MPWRIYDYFWFDWISRDFFAYLYWKANKWMTVPGKGESTLPGRRLAEPCRVGLPARSESL
jgi:hypothetical protein